MFCISNIRPILCSNTSFITGQTETFHFCSSYMQNETARSLSVEQQLILRINNPLLRRTHSCRRITYLKSYWRRKTGTSYFIIILAYYLTHLEKHTTVLLSILQVFLNFLGFIFHSFILILFITYFLWRFASFHFLLIIFISFLFFPFLMDDIMMLIVPETVSSLIRSLMYDELKFIWKVPFKGLNAVWKVSLEIADTARQVIGSCRTHIPPWLSACVRYIALWAT